MADGTLKVGTITTSSGSGTITLGQSGETLALGSGVTSKFNQPAFTKISVDEEVFDTDNCYDNSTNYRFTPTVAGKYFVYWVACGIANSNNVINSNGFIYKNGSIYNGASILGNSAISGGSTSATAIIDFNGSTDYVEFYLKVDAASGTVKVDHDFSGGNTTYAGAYRLGVE